MSSRQQKRSEKLQEIVKMGMCIQLILQAPGEDSLRGGRATVYDKVI
jgi:hypothetical protein